LSLAGDVVFSFPQMGPRQIVDPDRFASLDNISSMKTKHAHLANLALSAALCAALPAFADGPKLPVSALRCRR